MDNRLYRTGAIVDRRGGSYSRAGAMLLGTKDAPASGDGSEGGWLRLRGFLDDV